MTGELLAFALVVILGQFSPGPDMLLLTRTSLVEGLRAGWLMTLGIVTGLAFHAALAIGGMAALISRDGPLGTAISWLAAAYLLWLASNLIRKKSEQADAPPRLHHPYLRGLLCNLLNPKVLVFFAGVVAPFLDGEHPEWWPFALWLTIIVEGLIGWSIWVRVLQIKKVREGYEKLGPLLDTLFAILLTILAVSLVVSF